MVVYLIKNALIPVIAMVGGAIPIIIGGSLIIELIFNLPGIGLMLFDARTNSLISPSSPLSL